MEMPNEFFSTQSLATFVGLVAAVYVIVGFFKPWIKPKLGVVAVRPLAALVALVLQLFVLAVTKGMSVETVGLAVFNSFLVSMTAAGVHEFQKDPAAQTPQTIKPPDGQ